MADDVVFVVNTVAAVHVTAHPGDVQGFAATVALYEANHLWRSTVFVHEATDAQAGVKTQRDLGLHVGELLLDQLVLGQRASKLLTV